MSTLRSDVLPAIWLLLWGKLARVAAASVLVSAAFISGSVADSLPQGMDGLVVVELRRLPPPPELVEADSFGHLLVEPRTAGGVEAKALGWAVTGEVSLGGLDVVSFVAVSSPAPAAHAGRAMAMWRFSKATSCAGWSMAKRTQADASGASNRSSRALSGSGAATFSRSRLPTCMSMQAARYPLRRWPMRSSFATGRLRCPTSMACRSRQRARNWFPPGWGPVLGILAGEPPDSRAEALKAAGLHEVQSCSPTGFGFCSFRYSGQFAELSVVTVGEGAPSSPEVARYGVSCAIPGGGANKRERGGRYSGQRPQTSVSAAVRMTMISGPGTQIS